MTDQTPEARLRELARRAARIAHDNNVIRAAGHPAADHCDPFDTCEHVDCFLIRSHHDELKRWRDWAQFVYLGGGPVVLSDADLRAAVCASHDKQVQEAGLYRVEPSEAPTDATGHGRLLLNAYGRRCYNAGRDSVGLSSPAPQDQGDPIAAHIDMLFRHYGSAEAVLSAVRAAVPASEDEPT